MYPLCHHASSDKLGAIDLCNGVRLGVLRSISFGLHTSTLAAHNHHDNLQLSGVSHALNLLQNGTGNPTNTQL